MLGERSNDAEAKPWGLVEFLLVRMPAWVTKEGENPSGWMTIGFQGKGRLPWVSRVLRRGRKAYSMDNRLIFLY